MEAAEILHPVSHLSLFPKFKYTHYILLITVRRLRILNEDNYSVPELYAVWENDTLNFRI